MTQEELWRAQREHLKHINSYFAKVDRECETIHWDCEGNKKSSKGISVYIEKASELSVLLKGVRKVICDLSAKNYLVYNKMYIPRAIDKEYVSIFRIGLLGGPNPDLPKVYRYNGEGFSYNGTILLYYGNGQYKKIILDNLKGLY